MSIKTLLRSFAAGEVTPELYGRIDLSKYITGLAKCLNFTTLPHGPASRRPGFRFCVEARNSAKKVRLIPFAYSADQTVILEFGDQYIRFLVNGQALLETSKAIVSIVGSTVTVTAHGWTTGDDVFIGNRFHRITVTGANTFTTANLWGAATVASGTTAARVYTISSPYLEADLFDLHYTQNSDVLTVVHPGYAARELARLGATNWTLTAISFAPTLTPPSGVTVTSTIGTAGNQSPQSYCVTVIGADGVTESLASSVVSTSNNLSVAGNYNTVQANSTSGLRYNFYKKRGGAFGYIGQTVATGGTVSIVDDNVLADTSKTPPENIYTLNTATGEYPAAVSYYEQRRWFAGTVNDPQNVWATRNGTESNLTSSVPSQDDDGLQFRIASRQQNAIRHLLPLADMIALTVGGEFRIFADSAPNITPTSLSIKPQGYSGSANVQPALTSGSILYVQSQGSRVREMAYNWQSNAYTSIDISIMAPHLFNGHTLLDVAYCRAPVPTFWAIRDDGVLLGMTYVPEQQVYGWHQHSTAGVFESVAVVSEGNEDVLYAVVRRTINGRSVRYIERLQSRIFTDQSDAFYVDSGLIYSGAPVSSLTGLYHLEGQQVQVLADGSVHPVVTVTNGAIALDHTYSKVSVGLAYNSDLMTLPLAFEGVQAGGQFLRKNVNAVALRVTQSSLLRAGPGFNKLTDYPDRDVSDNFDTPPALKTAELRMAIGPSWNSDGGLCVRQDQPLPLTVLSIALEVAPGG